VKRPKDANTDFGRTALNEILRYLVLRSEHQRRLRFSMDVLSDLQSLSTQGHTGDALAFIGDEGRDKLRKAPVRRTWPFDPEVSEWENPARFIWLLPS
jgi:hypothetical protein